jgi:hypothetical protein
MKGRYAIGLVVLALLAGLAFLKMDRENTPAPVVEEKEGEEEVTPEITYTNSSADLVVVELPFPGAVVGKDFSVIGKARGTWFFEASFPLLLLDKDGAVLAQSYAMTADEWMTTEFVNFKGDFKVPEYYIGPATLILSKDNPAGEPRFDASLSFPIIVEY